MEAIILDRKSKVPAIDKADKIFNYLYHKYSATQANIAKDLNLSKATVNRLLEVLTNLKYLNFQDKEYSLGEKFYFFSSQYEKYTLLKNITHPYLEELSLKFKETFKLSILDNDKIRSIDSVESSDIVKVSVSENSIFPLHAGAASKLLICQLSQTKLNKLLNKTLPRYTENTITDREKLKKELFKINLQKISYDNMEHSKNIKAIAIPILDNKNKIIAAISCPCFPNDLTEEKSKILVKEMQKICMKISQKIEYFTN